MTPCRQRRLSRVADISTCAGTHVIRCNGKKTECYVLMLLIALMIERVGNLVNCTSTQDNFPYKAVVRTTRGNRSENAGNKFMFLTSVLNKVHAGWLQGRTTDSKAYFDDQYISLSQQIYSEMEKTMDDRWRQLQHLSRAVRKKIDDVQNPPNCNEAKLLVYDIRRYDCGFGCHLHTILFHFITSVYENRTFVLQSDGWNYDERGWEHSLMPLGKCKYNTNEADLPLLSDETEHERVVTAKLDAFEEFDWSVPAGILSVLAEIHPDPYAWWVGQFVAYAFRLQPHIINHIQRIGNDIGFTDKVVGIHVRWGDKLDEEATKHEVDEYMGFVKTWFRRQELRGEHVKRVVYVATENSEVWIDLKSRYPAYNFIGGGYVNETKDLEPEKKGYYEKRKNALESILIDLHFLSKCDYVVCTLSSRDVTHYRAIQRHVKGSEEEMSMEIGEEIIGNNAPVNRSRMNGYYPAMNDMAGRQGDVPAFKLELIVQPSRAAVFDDL